MTLQSLVIYLAVFFLNILLNIYFFLGSRKNPVYKYASWFWIALFLSFFTQAYFSHPYAIALSESVYFLANFSIVLIFAELLKIKINWKFYLKIMGFSVFLAIVLIFARGSFTAVSMPIIMGINFPIIHFFFKYFKLIWKVTVSYQKVFIFCIWVNTLHFFDYPFLRLNLEFAEQYGFPFNFLFTLICSFMMYVLSDSVYIKSIEKKLTRAIEDKNELLKISSISEMLVGISHEINNNLQIIMFESELLKMKDELPIDQKIQLSKIDNAVLRINRIIYPIRKSLPSKEDVFSTNEMFSEVKSLLQENTALSQKTNFDSSSKQFLGNKNLLVQIILNLIKSIYPEDLQKINILQSPSKIIIETTETIIPVDVYLTISKVLVNKIHGRLVMHPKMIEFYVDLHKI